MIGFQKILSEIYTDFKSYVTSVSDKYTDNSITIDGIEMICKSIKTENDAIMTLKEISKYNVAGAKDSTDIICRILKIPRSTIREIQSGQDILINGTYYHTLEITTKNDKSVLLYGYQENRKSFIGGFLIVDTEKWGA